MAKRVDDIVDKNDIKYDVKTKRCTSEPKPYYDCSVANFNTKQQCDRYVFVRVENKNRRWGRAWVLGWLGHDEYFEKSRHLKKGQIDPSNNFVVRADCHNVAISELNKFRRSNSVACKSRGPTGFSVGLYDLSDAPMVLPV